MSESQINFTFMSAFTEIGKLKSLKCKKKPPIGKDVIVVEASICMITPFYRYAQINCWRENNVCWICFIIEV